MINSGSIPSGFIYFYFSPPGAEVESDTSSWTIISEKWLPAIPGGCKHFDDFDHFAMRLPHFRLRKKIKS